MNYLQLHCRYHYGRDRTLEMLNEIYYVPNKAVREKFARVKDQCHSCSFKGGRPSPPPTTPITSMDFGERILVDLKALRDRHYMIVAICHWSNYCWLGYLENKGSEGVADFLGEVFDNVQAVRKSWPSTHEESKKTTKGAVSYPVNEGEVRTHVEGPTHVYPMTHLKTEGELLEVHNASRQIA